MIPLTTSLYPQIPLLSVLFEPNRIYQSVLWSSRTYFRPQTVPLERKVNSLSIGLFRYSISSRRPTDRRNRRNTMLKLFSLCLPMKPVKWPLGFISRVLLWINSSTSWKPSSCSTKISSNERSQTGTASCFIDSPKLIKLPAKSLRLETHIRTLWKSPELHAQWKLFLLKRLCDLFCNVRWCKSMFQKVEQNQTPITFSERLKKCLSNQKWSVLPRKRNRCSRIPRTGTSMYNDLVVALFSKTTWPISHLHQLQFKCFNHFRRPYKWHNHNHNNRCFSYHKNIYSSVENKAYADTGNSSKRAKTIANPRSINTTVSSITSTKAAPMKWC